MLVRRRNRIMENQLKPVAWPCFAIQLQGQACQRTGRRLEEGKEGVRWLPNTDLVEGSRKLTARGYCRFDSWQAWSKKRERGMTYSYVHNDIARKPAFGEKPWWKAMKRAWDCVGGIIGTNWFPWLSLLKAEAEFNVQKMIWQSLSPCLTCLNCPIFLTCLSCKTQINKLFCRSIRRPTSLVRFATRSEACSLTCFTQGIEWCRGSGKSASTVFDMPSWRELTGCWQKSRNFDLWMVF